MSSSYFKSSGQAAAASPPLKHYNVILLGELGVGKTTLFRRLNGGEFSEYVMEKRRKDKCTISVTIEDGIEIGVSDPLYTVTVDLHA